jgi:hypothetical protein
MPPGRCKQLTAHTFSQKLEAQISNFSPGLRRDNKLGASCGPPGQWAALRVRAHEVCAAKPNTRVASLSPTAAQPNQQTHGTKTRQACATEYVATAS